MLHSAFVLCTREVKADIADMDLAINITNIILNILIIGISVLHNLLLNCFKSISKCT